MTNPIGGARGPGAAREVSGGDAAHLEEQQTIQEGAPGAVRTARPKSLDMAGLGLAGDLEAKLAAATAGKMPAAGAPSVSSHAWPVAPNVLMGLIDVAFGGGAAPRQQADGTTWTCPDPKNPELAASISFARGRCDFASTTSPGKHASCPLNDGDDVLAAMKALRARADAGQWDPPLHPIDPLPPSPRGVGAVVAAAATVATPTGSGPRPTAGAADAKALEGLIWDRGGVDPKLGNTLWDKIGGLVTIDRREGIEVNPNATEGDLNRLKMMLSVLEADGKLGAIRNALHGPAAGPRLISGSVEGVMTYLVQHLGTPSQKAAWGN